MSTNTPNLLALYTAPGVSRSFEHELPTSTSTSALAAKHVHLSALQALVPKLQEEINVFLTERMEEDKKSNGISEMEAKEEENYGEELVEEDA
ncbi:hypothetical protein N7495_009002 [Penicillium taxi]|uniref:uncharacterized protein n=1 Tax=Penicillium taxi TaxID=168475 RepID=UPI002544E2AC|nr:uncharacterized protein N7495_009002 [Penicillium taxi]KAJ5888961.1 hypothetical protein N7495_009002 [Penicillium taxi]